MSEQTLSVHIDSGWRFDTATDEEKNRLVSQVHFMARIIYGDNEMTEKEALDASIKMTLESWVSGGPQLWSDDSLKRWSKAVPWSKRGTPEHDAVFAEPHVFAKI